MRWQHRRVLRGLRQAGVAPQDLALIALTHWHIDHVGSLAALQRRISAPVVAHRADAPVIQGQEPPTKPTLRGESGKFARWLLVKLYRPARVDRQVEATELLPEAGLRVIGTPGHTPGHVCYLQEQEGILFVGDALVNRGDQLDLSPEGFSQDPTQARASLEVLRWLHFDRCYFGHGEPLLKDADRQVWAFVDKLGQGAH
jgi:glyoxylase-like metal-dependent hydrolase (beta-lactamase superfamily II)